MPPPNSQLAIILADDLGFGRFWLLRTSTIPIQTPPEDTQNLAGWLLPELRFQTRFYVAPLTCNARADGVLTRAIAYPYGACAGSEKSSRDYTSEGQRGVVFGRPDEITSHIRLVVPPRLQCPRGYSRCSWEMSTWDYFPQCPRHSTTDLDSPLTAGGSAGRSDMARIRKFRSTLSARHQSRPEMVELGAFAHDNPRTTPRLERR